MHCGQKICHGDDLAGIVRACLKLECRVWIDCCELAPASISWQTARAYQAVTMDCGMASRQTCPQFVKGKQSEFLLQSSNVVRAWHLLGDSRAQPQSLTRAL